MILWSVIVSDIKSLCRITRRQFNLLASALSLSLPPLSLPPSTLFSFSCLVNCGFLVTWTLVPINCGEGRSSTNWLWQQNNEAWLCRRACWELLKLVSCLPYDLRKIRLKGSRLVTGPPETLLPRREKANSSCKRNYRMIFSKAWYSPQEVEFKFVIILGVVHILNRQLAV